MDMSCNLAWYVWFRKKLEPKLAKKPMQVSLHNKNPVLKPLYKWEKRPSPSNEELEHQGQSVSLYDFFHRRLTCYFKVSSFYEPITNTKSIYRPCIEPGHYIRSEITTQTLKSPSKGAKNQQEHTQTNGEPFEFRIILTEEEMKSLKVCKLQGIVQKGSQADRQDSLIIYD
jgi:hypothetical protein